MRGASKGEGLGNQFLGHIREVDAVAYVLRCFEDPDITHVEGRIDPVSDAETVETELMIADMESLERRRDPLAKKADSGDKEAKVQVALIDKALALVSAGKPARLAKLTPEEERPYRQLQLLTAKPVVYVCNVDEASIGGNELSKKVEERAKAEGAGCVVISAKIEAELAALEPEERQRIPRAARPQGARPQRADQRRLPRAEPHHLLHRRARRRRAPGRSQPAPRRRRPPAPSTPISRRASSAPRPSPSPTSSPSAARLASKQAGKMRLEGKEYVVKDGDVMLFRFAN